MPKFVIEREISGAGRLSAQELRGVLFQLKPNILDLKLRRTVARSRLPQISTSLRGPISMVNCSRIL